MRCGRRKNKIALFEFKTFSKKQIKVFTWWMEGSPVRDKDIIICDGSVRSGKTVAMALSFIMWSNETYNGKNLALCGKTIGSLRRNVLQPLKLMLISRGYEIKEHRADNYLTVRKYNKVIGRTNSNDYYLFGGKDESSQDLIQGVTLAGILFDEVVLIPESFVNQATARCSADESKMWFNCNPGGPHHWFKVEYLDKLKEKNVLHIHFTMNDNLSLSEKTKKRYYHMYSGVFFKRFILGLWVLAQGVIYDMFDEEKHVKLIHGTFDGYFVSVDYGTLNPCTFGLYSRYEDGYYLIKEYYYSGKGVGRQKTDSEYSEDMKAFIGEIKIDYIIVDPSAASFIAQLRKDDFKVIKADNDVLNGIRVVGNYLAEGKFIINPSCKDTIKEFSSYIWDDQTYERGVDRPVKENDHAMDRNRYAINTDRKIYRKNRKNISGRGAMI